LEKLKMLVLAIKFSKNTPIRSEAAWIRGNGRRPTPKASTKIFQLRRRTNSLKTEQRRNHTQPDTTSEAKGLPTNSTQKDTNSK
jgi:hypothetical protein